MKTKPSLRESSLSENEGRSIKTACTRLLPLLLVLTLPPTVQGNSITSPIAARSPSRNTPALAVTWSSRHDQWPAGHPHRGLCVLLLHQFDHVTIGSGRHRHRGLGVRRMHQPDPPHHPDSVTSVGTGRSVGAPTLTRRHDRQTASPASGTGCSLAAPA